MKESDLSMSSPLQLYTLMSSQILLCIYDVSGHTLFDILIRPENVQEEAATKPGEAH